MKRWIIIGTILVAVAAVLFATRNNRLRAEAAPQKTTVTRGTVVQEALAIGSIVPEQEVSVKSKIPGIVAEVHVAVGDEVRVGDPLIDIRPDPTPLERAEAQRNLDMAMVGEAGAKRDLERAEELSRQGLLSQKEMDDARSAYDSAHLRAQLEKERLDLIQDGHAQLRSGVVSNRITSPVDGTVLSLDVHPGDPVVPLTSYQAGTVLLTLADMSRLIFRGTVDEIDVGRLDIGRPARFTVGAIPDAEVTGTLSRISPKARKQESATLFDVEADIHQTPGTVLRAGYSTNAKILIARADSVLTLPERVVKYENGKATVRVPGDDGKPVVKEVATGLSDGLTVEIREGLDLDQEVLEPPPSAIARK